MADFLDDMIDNTAKEHLERGEGTGAVSKILSLVSFLILTILAAQLLRDRQWIPLIVLAGIGWTGIAYLAFLAGVVYFVITKYWIGAAIILLMFCVTQVSAFFGKRSVKRLLISDAPMINPFEGMAESLPLLVTECLLLLLALVTTGWAAITFWSLFGLVVLYNAGRIWFRLQPRWHQVHYPLMVRYAGFTGFEAAVASERGGETNHSAAAKSLLRSVYPAKGDAQLDELLARVVDEMHSFSDRPLLAAALHRRYPKWPQKSINDMLVALQERLLEDQHPGLFVRWVLAGIVETVFGKDERARYLVAVAVRGED